MAYTVGHCMLLMRSWGPPNGPDTTIDVLFRAVAAMKLRTTSVYDGLVIRCAGEAETDEIKAVISDVCFDASGHRRVFLLESQGEIDFIVSSALGWQEGVLEATRHSFFQESDDLRWPTGPFAAQANRAGWDVASAQDVIDALRTDPDPSKYRDRHRTVYAVLTRASKSNFPGKNESWIEKLPIGI